MKPTIIRPRDLPDDRKRELLRYVMEMWLRAERGRKEQVDSDYAMWSKVYTGTPLEEVRTVPFYKASNLVVKLVRIFIDTFTARTLNIIFATRPLLVVSGLPRDLKEAWELYINEKALHDWDYYTLCRDMLQLGNKNGTAIVHQPWVECTTTAVTVDGFDKGEKDYTYYAGPEARVLPFEDFYVYPITANRLCDVKIKFTIERYTEEEAKRLVDEGKWVLFNEKEVKDVATYCYAPRDAKRAEQQYDAGITDNLYRELKLVRANLSYQLTNEGGKYYDIDVLIHPMTQTLFDVHYNPYPRNMCIFSDYRPYPREDLFYGESACQILGYSQEEATRIHNERRDNSTIASSVVFKRRSGSLIPNPSTDWYPGKVFDLDDMQDLDVVQIGRNIPNELIEQEDYVFQLAQQLVGINEAARSGQATGSPGARGVYNTVGTIATMQESNQRQDTNIRDAREVLGAIGKTSAILQATYGADDPRIDTLSDGAPADVRAAIKYMASDSARFTYYAVKPSSAGINKEVERMNLMQMAQILGQYGATVREIGTQLLDQQINQGLRMILNDVITMQAWMAKRLLKQFDEWDAIEVLPDVNAAVESVIRGGSRGTKENDRQASGGLPGAGPNPPAAPPVSRDQLASSAQLPQLLGIQNPAGGNGSAYGRA